MIEALPATEALASDGGARQSVWILAATNQNLRERVREGTFREDLLYRLEVVRIDVPGLPKRRADIALLAVLLTGERSLTLSEATATCERLLVNAALRAEGNNRTRAAGRLGINVRTIYKKMSGRDPAGD